MVPFNGKRTDRLRMPKQLRFPSELAAYVRKMSVTHRRSIELQILHLIEQGIRYEEERKADGVPFGHAPAPRGTR